MKGTTMVMLQNDEAKLLADLIANGNDLSAKDLSLAIETELRGNKRKCILIALNQLYRNITVGEPQRKTLSFDLIRRKLDLSETRSRKNFVRRVFKKNKLFALAEIRLRYPRYTEQMLREDLKIKRAKPKNKKQKPIVDLRRCQLGKLAVKLSVCEMDENEYHTVCNRIALLQNAHNHRLPIPLTVKLQGETLVYDFNWKTRERIIKNFVEMANVKGMTHEQLRKRYQEIISSPNSF